VILDVKERAAALIVHHDIVAGQVGLHGRQQVARRLIVEAMIAGDDDVVVSFKPSWPSFSCSNPIC
jgi:hypothetical protein